MRFLIHVRNKHPNAAGSLEGFVEAAGRRVAYSVNWDMARRDPVLVREMVEMAKSIALQAGD
jgi:hypothetical protein